jgi:hypothetical protein
MWLIFSNEFLIEHFYKFMNMLILNMKGMTYYYLYVYFLGLYVHILSSGVMASMGFYQAALSHHSNKFLAE